MSIASAINRRQARRYEAAFGVRVSVNGGPEFLSHTLNFTSRSLAIRSGVPVEAGDRVDVRFGALPDITGEVARVFPEGFAVVLCEASLEMMRRARAPEAAPREEAELSVTSPFIRVNAPFPARALISSGLDCEPGFNRHYLTIVSADASLLANAESIWVCAGDARWIAGSLRFERRNNRGLAVMALNDWQAHMGAAYGLRLSIAGGGMQELTLEIAADPIAEHLETLAPVKLAVSA